MTFKEHEAKSGYYIQWHKKRCGNCLRMLDLSLTCKCNKTGYVGVSENDGICYEWASLDKV